MHQFAKVKPQFIGGIRQFGTINCTGDHTLSKKALTSRELGYNGALGFEESSPMCLSCLWLKPETFKRAKNAVSGVRTSANLL